jgi:hypothetical protein
MLFASQAIAVHTFSTVWWGFPHAQALAVPLVVVVLIYTFTGLYAVIATVAHQEAGSIRFLPSKVHSTSSHGYPVSPF